MHFKMSTICFKLDQAKVLSSGDGLNDVVQESFDKHYIYGGVGGKEKMLLHFLHLLQ